MKDYEWRSSIEILQNIFMFDESLKNSAAAQEHIEALTECINELYSEQKHMKYTLEEETIHSCKVKLKYRDYKKRLTTDIDKAVVFAKERNKKVSSSIQLRRDKKDKESKQTEKKIKNILDENEKLVERRDECRKTTDKLLDCMGALMQGTAERRIAVTQTRMKTHDAYVKTMSVCDEISKTDYESAEHYEKFKREIAIFAIKAEAWKEKIAAQDKVVMKQKKEVRLLKLEIKCCQERNNDVRKVLQEGEADLSLMKAKRVDLFLKIRKKKEALVHEKTELECITETYETEKLDNQDLIERKINEIEVIVKEIAEEKTVRERLIVDNEWLVTSATNRKNRLYSMQTETKLNKQDIRTAHTVLTDILGDMAKRKEENTMLSENLFMVADSREMMEKFFSKKLRLLRTDLISERHLRHKADIECKMLEEFMKKYSEIDLGYPLDGDLSDNLEIEKDKLEVVIDHIEAEEKLVVVETEKEIARFERQEAVYKYELQVEEERVEAATVVFNNLSETKAKHEKHRDYLCKRKITIEKEFVELIKEDLRLQKEGIMMKESNATFEAKNEVLHQETEDLKDELDLLHIQLQEQPPRMKQELKTIHLEIYDLMKRFDRIFRANYKLEMAGKEIEKLYSAEQEEVARVSENIMSHANVLLSIKAIFNELTNEKTELAADAKFYFLAALKSVGGIKAISEERLNQVSETARHLESLIEGCITMIKPNRRIGSDTQLNKMKDLKKTRQEYQKRQTIH